MVKPFEDAVFAAQAGRHRRPGADRLRLAHHQGQRHQGRQDAVLRRGARRDREDLKRQKALRKFAEAADQFQNLVYEQADSLQPVAKALNLQVQTTPLLPRAQIQALGQGNAKFAQAVFSPESLQAKRNTEAIEVAPNTLVAARVVEYKPATPRPFDEVKAQIRKQLELKAASELAQAAGKEKLAQLQQGKDAGIVFGKPVSLTRNQAQPGFPPEALLRIFHADPAKLPAYVGTPGEDGGYSIYKVSRS